jgi:hypothetical protein
VTGPEDYRCRECGNLVLYRIDHTPECKHYPPQFTIAQQN